MKSILFLSITLLALASCNSSRMNFNAMSNEEIEAYNQTVSESERVYCYEETNSVRSRLARRRCATITEQQQQQTGNIGIYDSASSSRGIVLD